MKKNSVPWPHSSVKTTTRPRLFNMLGLRCIQSSFLFCFFLFFFVFFRKVTLNLTPKKIKFFFSFQKTSCQISPNFFFKKNSRELLQLTTSSSTGYTFNSLVQNCCQISPKKSFWGRLVTTIPINLKKKMKKTRINK